MKIFHFDELTGELLGEGEARPDPMEPGRFLIPAWATTVEPPQAQAGKFRAFNGSGWEYRDIVQESTEGA